MDEVSTYVIIDLEATCWQTGTRPERMETIEIGAVRLDAASLEIDDEFATFVRPCDEPVLSEFCRDLTSIRQEDVDGAPPFPEALELFLGWVGSGASLLCSWGDYDLRQLEVDCRRHGIARPALLNRHRNLKRVFADRHDRPPCGMRHALRLLSLELDGAHHRGIDDARNIAKIAKVILRGNGKGDGA